MTLLILGLILFLGVHSVRIFAEGWRTAQIAQRGEGAWKGLYSLASIVGFGLIIWGYGLARAQPVAAVGAAAVGAAPGVAADAVGLHPAGRRLRAANGIKAWVHHPMVLGVKVWALAHLLANHTLADLLLFGSFLVWAVLDFRAARSRDRAGHVSYAPGTMGGTAVTLVAGVVAWAVFAFWAHGFLFGVTPFGR